MFWRRRRFRQIACYYLLVAVALGISLSSLFLQLRKPKVLFNDARVCQAAHNEWKRTYAVLHKEIVGGTKPPRFVIFRAFEAGLGDHLSGILTLFYYALFTDRAFVYSAPSHLVSLADAFDVNYVDWRSSYTYDDYKVLDIVYPPKNRSEYRVPGNEYWFLVNESPGPELFISANFSELQNDSASRIFVISNRGKTFDIAKNPHYQEKIREWQLTGPTLARCAFDFLFKPNYETYQIMKPFLPELTDPKVLKIGIAIRVGDQTFGAKAGGVEFTKFRRYFECAQEVEQYVRREVSFGRYYKVVWLLVADSMDLREHARREYGPKVLTHIDFAPSHIDCGLDPDCRRALNSAAAEMLLFSHTQYQVITGYSGFGRWGAWLSVESRNPHIYTDFEQRRCTNPDSFETVANLGSGM